jgi:hypothetical protein
LSFAWAFIMPLIRADNSPSSSPSRGLGRDSVGGQIMVMGVRSDAQVAPWPPEVILMGGGRGAHSDLANEGSPAHSCSGGRWAPPGSGTVDLLAAGSNLPMAGLPGAAGCSLAGPLTSEMSEAAPISLSAALIDSPLPLMASPASLASRVASVAMPEGCPTASSCSGP